MGWDGLTVPKAIYRLRWELFDEKGELVAYSGWTPGSVRSFSNTHKLDDYKIAIAGEILKPYSYTILLEDQIKNIVSIEYLALLIRGVNSCVALGLVYQNLKRWVLVDGEIFDEEIKK